MVDTSFWCIFNKYGFVKATKTKGVVQPNEIQLQVRVKIPDKAFERPTFTAKLDIKNDQLPDIVHELEMELLKLKKEDGLDRTPA